MHDGIATGERGLSVLTVDNIAAVTNAYLAANHLRVRQVSHVAPIQFAYSGVSGSLIGGATYYRVEMILHLYSAGPTRNSFLKYANPAFPQNVLELLQATNREFIARDTNKVLELVGLKATPSTHSDIYGITESSSGKHLASVHYRDNEAVLHSVTEFEHRTFPYAAPDYPQKLWNALVHLLEH